jgi:hypothetical protein
MNTGKLFGVVIANKTIYIGLWFVVFEINIGIKQKHNT